MTYYAWFALFAIFAYLIATDESVAEYVVLLWKQGRLNYAKLKWWLLYSPANPIVKHAINRRSQRLAEELIAQIERETNHGSDASGESGETH